MASRMSALVTTPWNTPYSSCTRPICTAELRRIATTSRASSGFGNDRRLARQLADVGRPARKVDVEQILGLHDAERAVAIAVEHDASRVIGLLQVREDHGRRIGEVDHADLVARRHHGADREIAEPHHARDHLLLAGLEHAGMFGLDHQRADFVLADAALPSRRDGRAARAAPCRNDRAATPAAARSSPSRSSQARP